MEDVTDYFMANIDFLLKERSSLQLLLTATGCGRAVQRWLMEVYKTCWKGLNQRATERRINRRPFCGQVSVESLNGTQ